ncbi:MAG: Capsular polysaccharide biosynthesis protein [Nocardioides sp.]|nr:Capsular polysaccharide biosynthesis protein [Nocardioides sp.]
MRLRLRRAGPEPGAGPGTGAGQAATEPLRILLARLEGVQSPAVAIVHGGGGGLARTIAGRLPTARVTTYDLAAGLDELHVRLAADGPFDVLLDLTRAAGARRRFESLVFQARPGGVLVMRLSNEELQSEDGLLSHLASLQALRSQVGTQDPSPGKDDRTNKERDRDALAISVAEVQQSGQYLVTVNAAPTLAKIPELAMNDFLRRRGAGDTVVATVPAVEWAARCAVRASADAYAASLPSVYTAPELSLREYHRVTCLPRQAAYRDNFVLPESFRHNARKRLRNPKFIEWAPGFVRDPEVRAEPLSGSFFYLDNHVRGHFGHVMTEQISHLWGWDQAKERDPSMRALVSVWGGKPVGGWEYDLLAAAGIRREDLVVIEEPVVVEKLVTTSPMFSMPEFVHPGIRATYDSLGAALASRATSRSWPTRVFCSRRTQKRRCHNTAEVEQLFGAAGFEVIYPEDHTMADQAQFVRQAEVIAGFAGSGMFQISLTGGPKRVMLISSESYTAQNEYMMAAVLGHDLDVALCRPDVPRTQGRFSVAWYQSDFRFDHAREGAFVRDWLEEL